LLTIADFIKTLVYRDLMNLIKLPFEDYFISIEGVVYSAKKGQGGRYKGVRPLKSYIDKSGYLNVGLYVPNKKRFAVHRLMAIAKFGDLTPEIVTRHKDNNKVNNSFDNILIGTQLDNIKDREISGNTAKGDKSYLAKYTDDFCLKILNEISKGKKQADLCREYGLKASFLSNLNKGRHRKHLQQMREL
jgi:hypothetical protein